MISNRIYLCLCILFLLSTGCYNPSNFKKDFIRSRSFQEVIESKKLVLGTTFNPISFYAYKQAYFGFEYEFAKLIASKLKVKLEVKVAKDDSSLYKMLKSGDIDLIANGIIHLPEQDYMGEYSLTNPTMIGSLGVITDPPKGLKDSTYWHHTLRKVIRLPNTQWLTLQDHQWKQIFKRSDIAGLKDTLKVINYKNLYDEDSSFVLASTEIEYKLLDLDVLTNKKFVKTEKMAELSFLVNSSSNYEDTINFYIDQISNSKSGLKLRNKYLKKAQPLEATKDLPTAKPLLSKLKKGNISVYDEMIKEAATANQWDWRLVAAIIQKESNFTPNIQSPYGAKGLMQLVAGTGKRFGAENLFDPAQNINAGVLYMNYLRNYWKAKISDPNEVIKFVLASYNSGLGHIIDARKLAEKYQANPNVWEDNVAQFLLKKADPEYYKDPVCKLGYCKGKETVSFVQAVTKKYHEYQLVSP